MTGLRRCRACGAILAESDTFCGECGSDVRPQSPEPKTRPPRREESRQVARLVRAANLLRMRGRLDAALRACRQAAALDAESVMARSLLSELLLEQGDVVGAVEEMALTTELAKKTESSLGALEYARRSRAEIEASVVEEILAKEERQEPWGLARLFLEREAERGASRDFNLVLGVAGIVGQACALAAAATLNPLGFLWFALTGVCAHWAWRHARRFVGSERFWLALVLATGPFGFVIYILNQE